MLDQIRKRMLQIIDKDHPPKSPLKRGTCQDPPLKRGTFTEKGGFLRYSASLQKCLYMLHFSD